MRNYLIFNGLRKMINLRHDCIIMYIVKHKFALELIQKVVGLKIYLEVIRKQESI